tara:strand:+ start:623 stop:739 length:117 start_codon:yes stop_codon:yes gene_type:complete
MSEDRLIQIQDFMYDRFKLAGTGKSEEPAASSDRWEDD